MNRNLTLYDYVFSHEGQHRVLEFKLYADTPGGNSLGNLHMSGTNPGMTEEEQVRYAVGLARSGYYHLHLWPMAKPGMMESVGLFIVRPWDTSEVDSIVAEWFKVKFKYCWPIKSYNPATELESLQDNHHSYYIPLSAASLKAIGGE